MEIETLALGDFATNCYIIRSDVESPQCLVIDPGFDAEPAVGFLQKNSLTPRKILLTHGHCDHIAGVPLLIEAFGKMPVAIHSADAKMITSGRHNLAFLMGTRLSLNPADEELSAGQVIELGAVRLEVLATPGHTPGGVSFYSPDSATVFSGDTLFCAGIGRTDFPGGDASVLMASINHVLLQLPDDTAVYSGHGPATTIGAEKAGNPFLSGGQVG